MSSRSGFGIAFATALGLVVLLTALPALADDWPQWRGIERDGKSRETGLLQEWPEEGPSLVWRVDGIGAGYSSVSVADGRIFTMGDREGGQHAMALRESDGSVLWSTRLGPTHDHEYGGPRSTPTTDGDRIFVMTTEGDVVCLDASGGAVQWRRSLPSDFDGYLMKAMGSYDWKFSESPLIDGDRVIVTPGHVSALMVALDKRTGQELWRTQGRRLGPIGSDGAAYASAVISEAGGIRQYVQLVGRGLIGVEAATGRLLWNYNRVASDIANISTPLVLGDLVFASAGYGTGAAQLEILNETEGQLAEERYFLEGSTLQNHHGGLVLVGETLFTGTGHNKGFPIAIDFLTGDVAWGPIRNEGRASAAISYADGMLYFRYQGGRMILVEASATGYQERGHFLIPDVKKPSWAHPVIANGRLLLREQDVLLSYDITRAPVSEGSR